MRHDWMRNLRRKARILLDELEGSCLEVVLIPSHDHECAMRGGMIRAVQTQNADWYRKFCGEHSSNWKDSWRWSKFKTKIKRQHTIRALNELIDGKCATPYAKDLRGFIQRWKFEAWQMKEVKAA
jgi:hypothetical protein